MAVGLEWARAEFLGKDQNLISSQMRLRARCTASYSLKLALNYNCDFSWHLAEFFLAYAGSALTSILAVRHPTCGRFLALGGSDSLAAFQRYLGSERFQP